MATLFLNLKASDAKLNANTALRNLQSSLTDKSQPTGQSLDADAGQTLEQEAEEGPDDSDNFQEIRRVVPNIDNIATVMAEVLGVSMRSIHSFEYQSLLSDRYRQT